MTLANFNKNGSAKEAIEQWFSAFLVLSSKAVSPVVLTRNHKLLSLLLYNGNFTTVMRYSVNI